MVTKSATNIAALDALFPDGFIFARHNTAPLTSVYLAERKIWRP